MLNIVTPLLTDSVSCIDPNKFNDGRCIKYYNRCNTRFECDDGSDEDKCGN